MVGSHRLGACENKLTQTTIHATGPHPLLAEHLEDGRGRSARHAAGRVERVNAEALVEQLAHTAREHGPFRAQRVLGGGAPREGGTTRYWVESRSRTQPVMPSIAARPFWRSALSLKVLVSGSS